MSIALPILDDAPQRPVFAQGPRSLASVRMLRIGVTDRCNLRCVYCMPEEGVDFRAKDELLAPEEISAIAETMLRATSAVGPGLGHLKLTGGEPTVRRDLLEIVRRLRDLGPLDLSLTTNGLQLPRLAAPLRKAGVDRLTLSCDSLRADRYARITRGGRLQRFLDGLAAATDAGFERLKINVVVMAGWNDDEIADFAALTIERPWTVRFIEYMPLGDSAFCGRVEALPDTVDPDNVTVDNERVRSRLAACSPTGALEPVDRGSEPGVGPALLWRLPGARGRLGTISAMSRPFCETCNRLRLTSSGELRSCLFDGGEVDLRPALRPRIDRPELARRFHACVGMKPEVHGARGNRAMSEIGG